MLKSTELYALYSDQIKCLLRGKSEMWAIGFRNGLLSTKGSLAKDSFMAHLAPDYDIGFNEGVSYAIYKSATFIPDVKTVEVKPVACIPCL